MNLTYQNKGHNDVTTNHLVWIVANKVHEEGLHLFQEGRVGNAKVKCVVDTLASGEVKLKSSTLKTFNRKIADIVAGRMCIDSDEVDTIPSMAVNFNHNESEEGELNDTNDINM